jgi:hypothetical protein
MKHQNYFCDEMVVFVRKRFLRAEFCRCLFESRGLRASAVRLSRQTEFGVDSQICETSSIRSVFPGTWAMPLFHETRFLNQGQPSMAFSIKSMTLSCSNGQPVCCDGEGLFERTQSRSASSRPSRRTQSRNQQEQKTRYDAFSKEF